MVDTFSKLTAPQNQINYLKENCMAAYVLSLKKTGKFEWYEEYVEAFRKDRENFTSYANYAAIILPVKLYEMEHSGQL